MLMAGCDLDEGATGPAVDGSEVVLQYVGYSDTTNRNPACVQCHPQTTFGWRLTAHADALTTIQESEHAASYCIPCHTTGWDSEDSLYGADDAWAAASSDTLKYRDVQCEVCHGPASQHNNAYLDSPTDVLMPVDSELWDADLCGQCHEGTHHPYLEEWEDSAHAGSDASAGGFVATNPACVECHVAQSFERWVTTGESGYIADDPMPITCQACHTAHSSENPGQLRLPLGQNVICAKCHNAEGALPGEAVHHATWEIFTGTGRFPGRTISMPSHRVERAFSPVRLTILGLLALTGVSVTAVPDLLGATQQGVLAWKPPPGSEEQYMGSELCGMCHVEHAEALPVNPHAGAGSGSEHAAGDLTCEACHGPGEAHVNSGGDPDQIENFTEKDTNGVTVACLTCHAGSMRRAGFAVSSHMAGGITCTDCHSIHSPEIVETLKRKATPELCYSCHPESRTSFTAPEGHGLDRGLVSCEDCHNPHGSPERGLLNRPMINGELCAACHIDKRGPFVFEHAAGTVEGCVACHTPHGSANRFMLKTNRTSELCISCHTEAPATHNLADPRYQNCTTCHTAIHGSDSHRLFFRR